MRFWKYTDYTFLIFFITGDSENLGVLTLLLSFLIPIKFTVAMKAMIVEEIELDINRVLTYSIRFKGGIVRLSYLR